MLSDACHDFLFAFDGAAESLIFFTEWYTAPDYPVMYGKEVNPLRRACSKVRANPIDIKARVELLRAAASVMERLDAEPVFDTPIGWV